MSYDSSKLKAVVNMGIAGGNMFLYSSSEASSDVSVAGFFSNAGAAGRNPQGGMRVLDVVLVQETTDGGSPGRLTTHSVIGATANQSSTTASTGYGAGYDASISST